MCIQNIMIVVFCVVESKKALASASMGRRILLISCSQSHVLGRPKVTRAHVKKKVSNVEGKKERKFSYSYQ